MKSEATASRHPIAIDLYLGTTTVYVGQEYLPGAIAVFPA